MRFEHVYCTIQHGKAVNLCAVEMEREILKDDFMQIILFISMLLHSQKLHVSDSYFSYHRTSVMFATRLRVVCQPSTQLLQHREASRTSPVTRTRQNRTPESKSRRIPFSASCLLSHAVSSMPFPRGWSSRARPLINGLPDCRGTHQRYPLPLSPVGLGRRE